MKLSTLLGAAFGVAVLVGLTSPRKKRKPRLPAVEPKLDLPKILGVSREFLVIDEACFFGEAKAEAMTSFLRSVRSNRAAPVRPSTLGEWNLFSEAEGMGDGIHELYA